VNTRTRRAFGCCASRGDHVPRLARPSRLAQAGSPPCFITASVGSRRGIAARRTRVDDLPRNGGARGRALGRYANDGAAPRKRRRRVCAVVSNPLLANEAPLRCTKVRSMFRAGRASFCFVARAAVRRCSSGGTIVSVAPMSVRISTASASGAPSVTKPTLSLNGRQ